MDYGYICGNQTSSSFAKAIAVAAYSYMALLPLIQPPIMKLLVPLEERKIAMVSQKCF